MPHESSKHPYIRIYEIVVGLLYGNKKILNLNSYNLIIFYDKIKLF